MSVYKVSRDHMWTDRYEVEREYIKGNRMFVKIACQDKHRYRHDYYDGCPNLVGHKNGKMLLSDKDIFFRNQDDAKKYLLSLVGVDIYKKAKDIQRLFEITDGLAFSKGHEL